MNYGLLLNAWGHAPPALRMYLIKCFGPARGQQTAFVDDQISSVKSMLTLR